MRDGGTAVVQLRAALRARLVEAGFTVEDVPGDELTICARRDGKDTLISFERLHERLLDAPAEAHAHLLEEQLEGLLEPLEAAPGTREQLVPMIKPRAWAVAGLATTDLVSELVVAYAWDRPRSLQYATYDELAGLGIAPAEALALAADNLRSRLPPELRTQGDGRSFLFAVGGNVEASLLVLPEIWDELASKLPGEIVVCAPARDVCLVTSTGVPGGIGSLVAARDRLLAQLPACDLLSAQLLVRRDGKWTEHTSERA